MNKKLLFAAAIIIILISIGVYTLLRGTVAPELIEDNQTPTTEVTEPYVAPFPDDIDRDGLTDAQELELGLDTSEYDTDLDGLADGLEVEGTKTDPTDPDTDKDGLSDGQEFLIWKTDPNKKDTDGDGFDDASEIDNGYNPNGSGKLTF